MPRLKRGGGGGKFKTHKEENKKKFKPKLINTKGKTGARKKYYFTYVPKLYKLAGKKYNHVYGNQLVQLFQSI